MEWKNSYESGRRYLKLWEEKYVWVKQSMDGKQNAFCKICHQSITLKASNLANHEKSDKHIKNMNAYKLKNNSTKSLPFANLRKKTKEPSEDVKRLEIELSVGISCHTAINSIDHLGQIMKRNGEGSIVGNIRLHRRKCKKLLTNVVAPALKEELKHLRAVKSDVLEEQYRKVLVINWVDENVFKGEIPDSTVAFWLGVLQYQNF